MAPGQPAVGSPGFPMQAAQQAMPPPASVGQPPPQRQQVTIPQIQQILQSGAPSHHLHGCYQFFFYQLCTASDHASLGCPPS